MADLTGKTALVTGAATGLGCASALAFAKAGAQVVVADVNIVAAEETAHAIVANGGKALIMGLVGGRANCRRSDFAAV